MHVRAGLLGWAIGALGLGDYLVSVSQENTAIGKRVCLQVVLSIPTPCGNVSKCIRDSPSLTGKTALTVPTSRGRIRQAAPADQESRNKHRRQPTSGTDHIGLKKEAISGTRLLTRWSRSLATITGKLQSDTLPGFGTYICHEYRVVISSKSAYDGRLNLPVHT